jgi:hypothetical protein
MILKIFYFYDLWFITLLFLLYYIYFICHIPFLFFKLFWLYYYHIIFFIFFFCKRLYRKYSVVFKPFYFYYLWLSYFYFTFMLNLYFRWRIFMVYLRFHNVWMWLYFTIDFHNGLQSFIDVIAWIFINQKFFCLTLIFRNQNPGLFLFSYSRFYDWLGNNLFNCTNFCWCTNLWLLGFRHLYSWT